MIKFNVLNRFTSAVKFTADIDCSEGAPPSIKLGLAVRWAVANSKDLSYANLDGANLRNANLRSIRTDFFDILLRAQAEVPALLATLRAGKINGSTYSGECACLCGTIANARHVDYHALTFVDSGRPAERWFLGIKEGDTPDSNKIAKITEEWILEFVSIIGVNSGSASVAA